MTSVVISPVAIQFFWNNQGQPNVGGSILTQVGGINTATYQDSAGAIPLPNPIPLNTRGEISNAAGISCQLFLTAGVTYTFTMYDAYGNQLNQAQYVGGGNSANPPLAVATIAVLRTVVKSAGLVVQTSGYYAAGDGGAGVYWYNSADTTSSDNGGTIIVANDGGRWYLIYSGQINVKQFGAYGDGTHDDTAACTAAAGVLTLGGDLFYPEATDYLITAQVPLLANTHVKGYGATIKVASTTPFTGGAFTTTAANVTVEGFAFDLGFTRCPTYNSDPTIQNCGVSVTSGATNLKVINCQFSNLYTVAIQYYTADSIEVRGCQFTSPAQTQQLHLEFIWLLTISGRNVIEDCSFNNAGTSSATGVCAVFASGTTGPIIIERCWTVNCSRDNTGSHRLETFAFYGNSVDVRIVDCFSYDNLSAWLRLADTARVRVLNNYVTVIASGAATDTALLNAYGTITYVGVGQVGLQDIQIVGNSFVNPAAYTGRTAIALGSQDFSIPSTDILISQNEFSGFHLNVDIYGPMLDVRVEKTESVSANGGKILFEYGSPTANNGVTEADSFYDGIFANDNWIQDTGSSNLAGIALEMGTGGAEYTGTLGQIEFNRNRVDATTGSTAAGIVVRGVNPANSLTRAAIRGNDVTGYATGLNPRFCQEAIAEENRLIGNTTPIDQAGNTMYAASGNRFATGAPWQGQAVLSAGTKTVSTTEVVTGDNIILTNVLLGGTAGFLNVGAIVNKTSFVITSSSNIDTSTIFWQIQH